MTQIICDVPGCSRIATVPMPRVMKYLRSEDFKEQRDTVRCEGWLFIREGTRFRHYCPVCAKQMISKITREMTH